MKKFKVSIAAIATAIMVTNGLSFVSKCNYSFSDLELANVRALSAQAEGEVTCSRMKSTSNCFDKKTHKWKAVRIKEVEVYTVTVGSPLQCYHDKVTECPYGTYDEED